jgi:hypothetical protein
VSTHGTIQRRNGRGEKYNRSVEDPNNERDTLITKEMCGDPTSVQHQRIMEGEGSGTEVPTALLEYRLSDYCTYST